MISNESVIGVKKLEQKSVFSFMRHAAENVTLLAFPAERYAAERRRSLH